MVAALGHVPAFERGDGNGGVDGDVGLLGQFLQRLANVFEGETRIPHSVEFVDDKDQGGDSEQGGQEGVATGLWQELKACFLPLEFARIHQDQGRIGARGCGHHVAGVLLVAWGVTDDEFSPLGGEVTVGYINGDALLALGRQAVGEQGQIGLPHALNTGQVVLQHRLGVDQQTANEGALAVVHRPTGDEFQSALGEVARRCRQGAGGAGMGVGHGQRFWVFWGAALTRGQGLIGNRDFFRNKVFSGRRS